MNSLCILINLHLKSNNLSRNNLAQLLGYKNIPEGLRNLEAYCLTLKDTNNIAKKLPEVLNISANEFENAVFDVQSKIDDKNKNTFLQKIQIIPSSRISAPIFTLAMFPSLLNITPVGVKQVVAFS